MRHPMGLSRHVVMSDRFHMDLLRPAYESCCSMLQLQCVAVYYSVLQCVVMCC